MQRKQVRTGPDLGTLACACSSLSRQNAKWEHFDCQPWIPVGDEHLSLIPIDTITTPPGRQTANPEPPVRFRPRLDLVSLLSRSPLAHNIAHPHALIVRYRPYHTRTSRPRYRRHEREQQQTGCENDGKVHCLTIRTGLQILEWAFGKRMTPAERLRKNQRSLDKAIRELDQVRVKLEKQEKTLVTQIRQSAQKNQMGAAKIQAKDLVRTRRCRRPCR